MTGYDVCEKQKISVKQVKTACTHKLIHNTIDFKIILLFKCLKKQVLRIFGH